MRRALSPEIVLEEGGGSFHGKPHEAQSVAEARHGPSSALYLHLLPNLHRSPVRWNCRALLRTRDSGDPAGRRRGR